MPPKKWIEYNYSLFLWHAYGTVEYVSIHHGKVSSNPVILHFCGRFLLVPVFLLFRLRRYYISSTTFAPILEKSHIAFLLVYFQPFWSQNRDHGNMASIQRCDCCELASGIYCIWRSSRTISNSMHAILTPETAWSAGNWLLSKFHQKFVEELAWIDEPMVSKEV